MHISFQLVSKEECNFFCTLKFAKIVFKTIYINGTFAMLLKTFALKIPEVWKIQTFHEVDIIINNNLSICFLVSKKQKKNLSKIRWENSWNATINCIIFLCTCVFLLRWLTLLPNLIADCRVHVRTSYTVKRFSSWSSCWTLQTASSC